VPKRWQAGYRKRRIVKTLNQVGAEMMADNAGLPHRPVMFMAGNLVALSNPEGLAERLLAYERDLTRQSHAVVS
jgi:hypothetical protein